MGKRNYLIEGVSGAGKTTVGKELQLRGYQVIHGDDELTYRGDRETGQAVIIPKSPTPLWMSEHQIWNLDKVKDLIANKEVPVTFLCGGSRNYTKFIDLLDGVFILEVDHDTMNRRIAERVVVDPTDFGGTAEERDLIEKLFQTKEDIPRVGIKISSVQPLARVVDDILMRIQM